MWFIDSSKTNEGSSASINGIRPTKDFFMSMEKYPIVFQAEITATSEPCREHLVQVWGCYEVIFILGGGGWGVEQGKTGLGPRSQWSVVSGNKAADALANRATEKFVMGSGPF